MLGTVKTFVSNPLVKRRALQIIGFIALVLVLVTAFLGCIFMEGLTVTISSVPSPAHFALTQAPALSAAAGTAYPAVAFVSPPA